MAITIENIQTPEMSATPSVTIAVPANAQTGDYLVVMYRCQINLAYLMAMTFGDAFTLVTGTGPNASGTADKRHTGIYIRKLDMSVEPSGYTFRPTQYASNTRASAVALLLRGVDQTNPVMDSPTIYGGTTSSTAHSTVESLTADGEALLVYMGAAELVANISHVPTETPSGVTLQGMVPGETESTTNSRTYVWGGTKNIASSGETGELTIGWASTTTPTSTAVLLRAATGAQPLVAPTPVVASTIQPTTTTSTDGSATVTWEPVSGASGYSAHIAETMTPGQEDFTLVASSVTSPYTFTGLKTGAYSFGIKALA